MVSGSTDAFEKEAAELIASIEAKKPKKRDYSYTQNRELSWLQFDRRVLEEALDPNVPVLERLKFVSIFCTNLDEFFMVRVGSITDLSIIAPEITENKANMTPSEQLEAIFAAVKPLIKERDEILAKVMKDLGKHGFVEIDLASASKKERRFARDYYRDFIRPVLSPQVVDERHPFPHLKNKELYIVTTLSEEDGTEHLGIIPVPENISPIIADPDNPLHFVRAEKLIAFYVHKIFDIYETSDPIIISVTRNADISFDEEKFSDDEGDYRLHVSRLLKKRNRLNPVRLEIEGKADKALVTPLLKRLKLTKKQAFVMEGPINLTWAFGLEKRLDAIQKAVLCYPPFTPRASREFDLNRSIIEQVKERDRLLFYPYDSMDPFLRMLQEAAVDPSVLSIKITVYRLASDSRVAQALAEAAENGKEVTTLMELRARFDEANNIDWAGRLEEAGCKIIYGMENYKCHSKVCLITKQENGRVVNITQIGTGNYNEKTARLYTDLSLLTADPAIGRDAVSFFQNLLIGNLKGDYEKLLVAPKGMKPVIMRLIDREIYKGRNGRITLKANSVTERDIIDKLSEASKAGVQIRMNIRGICCQLPGIKGKTENVHVRSIVGQFLEHSRIYVFGEGDDLEMFIGSADLMTRNLVHRVEVACPVEDPDIRASILLFLEKIFEDNTKARSLEPSGEYAFVDKAHDADMFAHEGRSCLHDWCIEHPLQDEARERLAEEAAAKEAAAQAAVMQQAAEKTAAVQAAAAASDAIPPVAASSNLVLDFGSDALQKDESATAAETKPEQEAKAVFEMEKQAEPQVEAKAEAKAEPASEAQGEETLDSLLAQAGTITESDLNAVPESEIDAVIESLSARTDEEAEAEGQLKAEAEVEPEAKAEVETEAKAEPADESKAEAATETEPEVKPEAEAEVETETEPEFKLEVEPEAEAEPEPEAETETQVESAVEARLVEDLEPVSEPAEDELPASEEEAQAEPEPEDKAEAEPAAEAKADAETESKPEAAAEPAPEAEAEPVTDAKPDAEPPSDKKPESELEPEPEPEAEPVRASLVDLVFGDTSDEDKALEHAEREIEIGVKDEPETTAKADKAPLDFDSELSDKLDPILKSMEQEKAELEKELEKMPEQEPEHKPEPDEQPQAEPAPEAEPEAQPDVVVELVEEAKSAVETNAVADISYEVKSSNKTIIEIEPQLEEPQPKSDPEPTVAEIMAAAAAAAEAEAAEVEAAEAKPQSAEDKLSRERAFASGAPHIPPKTEDEPAPKEEVKQEVKKEEQAEQAEPKKKGGFFKRLFS